jgi:hypothetical protein
MVFRWIGQSEIASAGGVLAIIRPDARATEKPYLNRP